METFELVVLYICAGVLSVSLLLTMFRMAIGPNSIDRVMSLDTISATAQCGVALYIAWTLDTTPIPMVLVLALIGFLGSVSVARFRVPDSNVVPVGHSAVETGSAAGQAAAHSMPSATKKSEGEKNGQ
jgi:multicomponent Na+:H+ antiporter subunit F